MKLEYSDPVLAAADRELERRENSRPRRMHLGMSSGGRCARQQWFNWLWVSQRELGAKSLRAIADGYAGEDIAAARIQAVEEVVLLTRDPETGEQWAVDDAGGHVAGHLDGVVMHHPTAPKTKHVWESKVVNERSLAKFRKIKSDAGEKATLREWNFEYWVQAQLYMLHTKMTRHWMVVSASGCRDWDSCRTELDRDQAEYFAERMRSMVANVDELPERVSESPASFACRFCDFIDVCHEGAAIERNCRTCRFSTPVDGPNWMCGLDDVALTREQQIAGCDRHRYRSALVPGEELSVDELDVTYRLRDGRDWTDGGASEQSV
tara:strand:+ start:168 stop:1133 length:966 start_codon:yes stop_codon:yes gene_type:complete